MGDYISMSKTELKRNVIFSRVKNCQITLKEAACKMDLSYRQTKRLWKRYLIDEITGIVHKGRGQRPNNIISISTKQKVLSLYKEKYIGFGPTFAAEKLDEDDGIKVNPETLRLWLYEANLFKKERKRSPYRKKRDRKPCFGDMLQIDGSIHNWLPNTERKDCLLNIVDDATGVTLAALDTGETTYILLKTFKMWIEKYGIPNSVYVDLKSVYVGTVQKVTQKQIEEAAEKEGFSHFRRVCDELGIEIIKAYSAQAKGRVERNHRVYQDRFRKSLKLYNKTTIEEANEYLISKYLDDINKKFALKNPDIKDSHRQKEFFGDLEEIICWQYTRVLKNNWTIQKDKEYYQLDKSCEKIVKPKNKIVIKKYLNGKLKFWFDSKELVYKKLSSKPLTMTETKKLSEKEKNEILKQRKSESKQYNVFNSNNIQGYMEGIRGNSAM